MTDHEPTLHSERGAHQCLICQRQKKQAKVLYFAHLFGFYMPWTRGWKFGFRTVREGNAYFRGFKDGRRRERERLLSDD